MAFDIKRILLAQPRGFCAGVERAISIVEKALEMYGPPVYVRHEIVHNAYVVDDLKRKGAIFVREVDEIPAGGITVFSAHGVSEKVESTAKLRDLPVIDATCPLVTKVHYEAKHYEKDGREIVLIGHRGHPEVEGTSGRVKQVVHVIGTPAEAEALEVKNPEQLAYVTQTTLSLDETRDVIAVLTRRFPSIKGPGEKDICYATQNRQNAVRMLAPHVQLLLVIGAPNSSNSNRLRDLGEEMGVKAYLVQGADEVQQAWLEGVRDIGITAGASAPELLVQQVIDRLKEWCPAANVEGFDGIVESVHFKLPREVRSPMLRKSPPASLEQGAA
jgi:4-hydroxy-3-methylbut-2-enyl diphosphate reductase